MFCFVLLFQFAWGIWINEGSFIIFQNPLSNISTIFCHTLCYVWLDVPTRHFRYIIVMPTL